MRPIATALALFALTTFPSAHQGSPSQPALASPSQARFVGTWKVDRRQFPDERDVWKRRVDAMPVDSGAARPAIPGQLDPLLASPVNASSGVDIALLRTAMRDLLETAERLSFQVGAGSVTITDDLNRTLTYATTGKKEQHQLAATKFDVKTQWNGQALMQELTAWTFGMTEVYLIRDDPQEMLVSIKIDKPQFQPPIKDISRVYVRVK